MLPASVRGVPLERLSVPILQHSGSDICLLMCSDEPARLAEASGVPIDEITYAYAFDPNGALAVAVAAIRFPGLDAARLIEVRLEAGSHSSDHLTRPESIKLGARSILWVTYWPHRHTYDNEYLYASGDVLFLISGWPPENGKAPRDVQLAVDLLP